MSLTKQRIANIWLKTMAAIVLTIIGILFGLLLWFSFLMSPVLAGVILLVAFVVGMSIWSIEHL